MAGRVRTVSIAVDWNGQDCSVSSAMDYEAAMVILECDDEGPALGNVRLLGLVEGLMDCGEDVRGEILDAIGIDAVKEHFGLVGLSQPKNGAR